MTEESPEGEIWERARAGEGAAYADLFRIHRDRVYRRALSLLGQVHDAEDVTAVAFFELWRKRRTVRVVNGTVLPWLLVTTAHLAQNQRRGQARYRRLIASIPRGEHPDAEAEALSALETEELGAELKGALARLSADDAALLLLTSLDGLTVADAAEVLGVKAGTARMRLRRARVQLQSDLASVHTALRWGIPEGEHA